jgi:hypothetical protein
LTYGTNRLRQNQRLIVGTIVVAILAATLLPSRTEQLRPFSFCLTCDFRWLADAVLNVGLFLPFGLAAGSRAKTSWKVALVGALLSTTIELLQMVVPGRDPELRDIVCNTAGAALGAALVYRPHAWLVPSPRRAAWLVGAVALALLGVVAGTADLLAPARTGAPGRIRRVETDAVLIYQSRADVIGLDQPSYYVRGLFIGADPAVPVHADVSHLRTGWCLHFGAAERCRIGPTLGRGWAALIYPAAVPHRWADALIDVAWTVVLFFPLGFWSTRRVLPLSFGAAIVLLGIVPSIAGLVPTTLGEWFGALAAMGLGYAIAESLRSALNPVVARLEPSVRTSPAMPSSTTTPTRVDRRP